jgi:hypothetical protein
MAAIRAFFEAHPNVQARLRQEFVTDIYTTLSSQQRQVRYADVDAAVHECATKCGYYDFEVSSSTKYVSCRKCGASSAGRRW